MQYENRYIRQRDIVGDLSKAHVAIAGVGAIGRQVALQLAAMGVGNLFLYDFDTVGEENLASQGFYEQDIGMEKVQAVANTIQKINSEIKVSTFPRKIFKEDCISVEYIFCCVDSISTRKTISNFAKLSMCKLFIDARMSAEVLRILTCQDSIDFVHYESTLFTDAEAYQGSCTAKSTIFTANIAAGLMISQLAKYVRGIPMDNDFMINLLSMELTSGKEMMA